MDIIIPESQKTLAELKDAIQKLKDAYLHSDWYIRAQGGIDNNTVIIHLFHTKTMPQLIKAKRHTVDGFKISFIEVSP
jgi:hypothetical protein